MAASLPATATDRSAQRATAWVRKAITENEQGKQVVLVYPVDKWLLMLLKAGAEVRNLGDVKWLATEDGSEGKGTGRHIAAFILRKSRGKPVLPVYNSENVCNHNAYGTFLFLAEITCSNSKG